DGFEPEDSRRDGFEPEDSRSGAAGNFSPWSHSPRSSMDSPWARAAAEPRAVGRLVRCPAAVEDRTGTPGGGITLVRPSPSRGRFAVPAWGSSSSTRCRNIRHGPTSISSPGPRLLLVIL